MELGHLSDELAFITLISISGRHFYDLLESLLALSGFICSPSVSAWIGWMVK